MLKLGVLLAHFLHDLYAILEGHLEVKYHETQWLDDGVVASISNCLLENVLASVDSYLAIDAVSDILDIQSLEERLEHFQVDVLVVSNDNFAEVN